MLTLLLKVAFKGCLTDSAVAVHDLRSVCKHWLGCKQLATSHPISQPISQQASKQARKRCHEANGSSKCSP